MQVSVSALVTELAPIIEKSMENRREIPAPPMMASRADVLAVKARIDRVAGVTRGDEKASRRAFVEAVIAAGYERNTAFKLLAGRGGSVGTLRDIEEWLLKEEQRKGVPRSPTTSEMNTMIEEWRELGERLLAAAPDLFGEYIATLRIIVPNRELEREAFRKLGSVK